LNQLVNGRGRIVRNVDDATVEYALQRHFHGGGDVAMVYRAHPIGRMEVEQMEELRQHLQVTIAITINERKSNDRPVQRGLSKQFLGGDFARRIRLSRLPGTDESQNYELPIAVERSPQLPTRRKRDRDREERIRQAGGPKPSLREKAYALARERATVKTCDFTAIGIPRHYLAWMCEEGLLVKVGYGVYRAADREAA